MQTLRLTLAIFLQNLFLALASEAAVESFGGFPTPIRIMPLGDSITAGDSGRASYRYHLAKKLEAGGYPVDFVGSQTNNYNGTPDPADFDRNHEGHWGWRTDMVLEEIDGWMAAYQPHIVLLHLGHNDIIQGEGLENATNDLQQLIVRIQTNQPNVVILLARVIPSSAFPAIQQLNDAIPIIAAATTKTNAPVILVDHWTGYDAVRDNYDGLHPNLSGERKMADRWFAALQNLLGHAPQVQLTAPPDGTDIPPGQAVNLSVSASDTDGTVTNVQIYADGQLIAEAAGTTLTTNWIPASQGLHLIEAHAKDTQGITGISAMTRVLVGQAELGGVALGLQVWMRADLGVVTNALGRVLRWDDQTGRGNHAIQPNNNLQPVLTNNAFLDHPALHFGGAQYLAASSGMSAANYTKVVVLQLHAAGPGLFNNVISSGSIFNGAHALWFEGGRQAKLYHHNVNFTVATNETALFTTTVLTGTYDAASNEGRIYTDGVFRGSGLAPFDNTSTDFQIGAFAGFALLTAGIAEVLIYDRVLSNVERDAVEAYLARRYLGIGGNQSPQLALLPDLTVHAGTIVQFQAQGSDPDGPVQALTYTLGAGSAPGAWIHPSTGGFLWLAGAPGSTNRFKIVVTDAGTPVRSAERSFNVSVADPLRLIIELEGSAAVRFRWKSVPGLRYRLEYKDAPEQLWWTPMPNTITAASVNTQHTEPIPPASVMRLYRVRSF